MRKLNNCPDIIAGWHVKMPGEDTVNIKTAMARFNYHVKVRKSGKKYFLRATPLIMHLAIMLFVVIAASSCSGTRYLGEDETFYGGSRIILEPVAPDVKTRDIERELETVLSPRPNYRILTMRPGVWIYNITRNSRERGIGNWIRTRIGRAPVLFDDVNPERIQSLMQNRLFNMGQFDANINYDITSRRKETSVNYRISIRHPYRIGNIFLPSAGSTAGEAINRAMVDAGIQSGDIYNLTGLKRERERIDRFLKDEGFFYFSPDYLLFRADSTAGNREVDLYLVIKPDVPAHALNKYTIGNIRVEKGQAGVPSASRDNEVSGETGMVTNTGILPVKESTLMNAIFFEQGQLYNSNQHELTIRHLMGLEVFKFVNIRFERPAANNSAMSGSGDRENHDHEPQDGYTEKHTGEPGQAQNTSNEAGNILDVRVILTPMEKKNISAELRGVSKSNNFAGPGITASFNNRNLLGGAENLSINLEGAFETLIGQTGVNSVEAGLTSELGLPGLLMPFRPGTVSSRYMPRTTMSLAFSFLDRTDAFSLSSMKSQFGYRWNPSSVIQHRFNPFSFNVFGLGRISEEYQQIFTDEALLRRGMFEQFLLGGDYSFFYNSQLAGNERNDWYFNLNLDASGNMAYLAGRYGGLAGWDETTGDYTFFNQSFSQYFKADADLRHYIRTHNNNVLAARLMTGLGVPYGNSTSLPYTKMFTIGGSNSIRAFHPRTLGPGSYSPPDTLTSTFNIYQAGEIKLEMNLEYRISLGNVVKTAIFADAGNIWNIEEKVNAPGGAFTSPEFLRQIALGTGAGLRFDFTFFLLRLDLAFPLAIPSAGNNEDGRYFQKIRPLDSQWRRDNLILNLAIGYPF